MGSRYLLTGSDLQQLQHLLIDEDYDAIGDELARISQEQFLFYSDNTLEDDLDYFCRMSMQK